MSAFKMTAISKHPDGTASFHLRVGLPSGGTWEVCMERPKSIPEAISELEKRIADLRRIHGD